MMLFPSQTSSERKHTQSSLTSNIIPVTDRRHSIT